MPDLYRIPDGRENAGDGPGPSPATSPLLGVPSCSGPSAFPEVELLVHLVEHMPRDASRCIGHRGTAHQVRVAPVAAGLVPRGRIARGEMTIGAFVVRRQLEIEQHQEVVLTQD